MQKYQKFFSFLSLIALLTSAAVAQEPTKTARDKSVVPAAGGNAVSGSGTAGRISKWTGVDGSNTFTLGNSIIFEDKFGKVGIGTTAPTSLLTVQGMIETTLGGYKFPDGTIQATAALSGTIAILHDNTLKGDGTTGQPLGLAVPLIFSGEVSNGNGVITVTNAASGGHAILATGGPGMGTEGGSGLKSLGGNGDIGSAGGTGLLGFGGSATNASAGPGGILFGGVVASFGNGGDGLIAVGAVGLGVGSKGGKGILAIRGTGGGGATSGLAGDFRGDVEVSGNLSKGGGSFKIDHPLDPENKYLYHSFVESPDMKNIYDGNIVTDENGEATVTLPDYFESLNRDFRYQLTVIGTFAQAMVAEEIKDNHFTIKTNAANVKVSWQVTGVRQDAYANKHRIPVEVVKPEKERGSYLHPEAFNQPEEKNVLMTEHPEMIRKVREAREKALKAKRD